MKYLGNISDPKDLVTKEYVDGAVSTVALPTPTAADNGKFVMVINGAYSLATVPEANGRSF